MQELNLTMRRIISWATGVWIRCVVALQGESALRFLSGVLTIYFAFWVESPSRLRRRSGPWRIAIASRIGTFLGTGTGLSEAAPP